MEKLTSNHNLQAKPVFVRYSLVAWITLLALGFQWSIWPNVQDSYFFLLYPTSMFCYWYLGFGPGLLSTVISVLGANYLFFGPAFELETPEGFELLRFAVFVLFTVIGGGTIASGRRAARRLEETEFRQRRIVESARVGTWDWDLRSDEIVCNETLEALFGLEPGRKKRPLADFDRNIHPEDRQEVYRNLFEAVRAKKEYRKEFRVVWPDGSVHWLSGQGRAQYDELLDEAVSILGTNLDITEHKREEEALEQREIQHEVTTELGLMALNSTEVETVFDRASRAVADALDVEFSQILQLLPEGYLVMRAGFGFKPERMDEMIFPGGVESQAGYTVLLNDGAVVCGDLRSETRFRDARLADECRIVSGASVVIHGPEKPFGVFGVHSTKPRTFSQDETHFLETVANILSSSIAKVVAEKAQKAAKEEAERANEAKSQFLANMSHEIRSPMNSVLGYADLLMRDGINEKEVACYAGRIKTSGEHLLHVLDDILDLSKVEAGRMSIEKRMFSVVDLATDCIQAMSVLAQKKGIRLRLSLKSPIPGLIRSDEIRLRQILTNLLSNAIKFTARGYVHVNLNYLVEDGGKRPAQLVIEVEDSGIGIADDLQSRLFRPFTQADNTVTRKYGGTGLGLYLSRQLAKALGGNLALAWSRPAEGSRFVLTLPVSMAEATPFITSLNGSSGEAADLSWKHSLSLQGLKILLVEDSVDNQELMRIYLDKAGAKVEIANNGQEGLEKALRKNYDVVLMDVSMPVLDGLQATKKLRAQGYQRPIIALTAHALKEEINKSLQAGCNAHLSKPVDRQELLTMIRHLAVPQTEQEPELRQEAL